MATTSGGDGGKKFTEEELDTILGGIQQWSPEERSKYCDEVGEHPLFMHKAPATAEDDATGAMTALSTIVYDETDTPEAMARESKEKGNAAFARGAGLYGHAIRHYNECIDHTLKARKEKAEMTALRSVAYANLAAVYLARSKYVTALDCCEQALRANPSNVKALYRAAQACLPVGRATAALQFCEAGSALEPSNKALADLAAKAREAIAVQERNAAAARAELMARRSGIERVRAAARERRMHVGPQLYRHLRHVPAHPYVDEGDVIHWPVLLLYPQYNQSDFLCDVMEVTPLSDLVNHVLPGPRSTARPPAWDVRGEYRADNVDVFFLSDSCKPIPLESAWRYAYAALESKTVGASTPGGGAGASSTATGASDGSDGGDDHDEPQEVWERMSTVYRIPPAAPIMLPLMHPRCVTADIPTFYVVARSSDTYKAMKARCGGTFMEVVVPELPPAPDEG